MKDSLTMSAVEGLSDVGDSDCYLFGACFHKSTFFCSVPTYVFVRAVS